MDVAEFRRVLVESGLGASRPVDEEQRFNAMLSGAIGNGLLDEARRQLGPSVSLILASVADAVGFHERIGMARLPDAFWYRREY